MATLIRYELTHPEALPPVQWHEGDAGWDVCCYEDVNIEPWGNQKINIGMRVEIPKGYYMQIAPRSGLSFRSKLFVMGGIVDRSYRGDICVLLYNGGREALYLKKHTRIAQLLMVKIVEPAVMMAAHLHSEPSTRKDKGFGEGTGLL